MFTLQRVHSSLIRQDGEEKFSYVIIQKRGPTDFEKAKADREGTYVRISARICVRTLYCTISPSYLCFSLFIYLPFIRVRAVRILLLLH